MESSSPKILWSETDKKWLIGVNETNDTTGLAEIISDSMHIGNLTRRKNADHLHTHNIKGKWEEVENGICHVEGNVVLKQRTKGKLECSRYCRFGGGTSFNRIEAGRVNVAIKKKLVMFR